VPLSGPASFSLVRPSRHAAGIPLAFKEIERSQIGLSPEVKIQAREDTNMAVESSGMVTFMGILVSLTVVAMFFA
jgi:hypothetical protein